MTISTTTTTTDDNTSNNNDTIRIITRLTNIITITEKRVSAPKGVGISSMLIITIIIIIIIVIIIINVIIMPEKGLSAPKGGSLLRVIEIHKSRNLNRDSEHLH